MNEELVKEFYGKIKFPGPYTLNDLEYFDVFNENKILKPYINAAKHSFNVLDIGCGTGFITNLLARKFRHLNIDAVDFCDSIDLAKKFSQIHGIKNVRYFKENFLDFTTNIKYDLIISNGVIHHIPEYKKAIKKIQSYDANTLVLGIYNKYGKIMKKITPINYRSELLHKDQEQAPFEVSFSHKEFTILLNEYTLVSPNFMVDFKNLFNYHNGGLTIYTFSKHV